jgi:predicted nucleic acid-binding protein
MNTILSTTQTNPDIERLSFSYPQLGRGELGAISIGLQMKRDNVACAILLDDKRARKVARGAGLPVFGTLRLLHLMHKNLQLTLKELQTMFRRLRETGFWFNEDVVNHVLAAEEEPPF